MTHKLLLAFIGLGLFANAGVTLFRPAYAQDASMIYIQRYLGQIAGSLGAISTEAATIAGKRCQ